MSPENQDTVQWQDYWYSKVRDNIIRSEYNISSSDKYGAYQSPNRANNLRFIYHPDGFTVKPRSTKIPQFGANEIIPDDKDEKYRNIPDWEIRFCLAGYGKDKKTKFKGNGLNVCGNTACTEDGNLKITYLNDERGMRQDFIVRSKPEGNSDKLILSFNLDTKLRTEISTDCIKFYKNKNQVLQYSSLLVTDADGIVLDSYFRKISGKEYQIIVNDRDAVYPVTIDPLSSAPDWTAECDQAGSRFGYSVSTAGDVNGDGYSDVIVGACYFDNGQNNEGKTFIYNGSATGLSAAADWAFESNQANSCFGVSVSTAGDVNGDGYSDVIIGGIGTAYLYLGSADGLSTSPAWTKSVGNYFGSSVSCAGDVNGDGYSDVLIGDYLYNSYTGRAFLYLGSASGLSTTESWTSVSNQAGSYFGYSVSTAGDVNGDGYSDIIIGAPLYTNGQSYEGEVFVYHGSATGLSLTADWTAESNLAGSYFGNNVSTAGDVNGDGYSDVIIGAPRYFNGQIGEGTAFVYNGSATGLLLTANWTAESNQNYSYFGLFVSTAGDVNGDGYSDVIVGAYLYDNGQSDEGRAFVYHGSSSGLSLTPNWTAESNQVSAWFGFCVSTAGDVNGDGYSDVIIGAHLYDNGQSDEGAAFVYYGGMNSLPLTANWTYSGSSGQYYAVTFTSAGDVNGDGYTDIIMGTYNGNAAFVFYGSSDGLSTAPSWTKTGSGRFGSCAVSAGDVNGDGYSDVIIGSYGGNTAYIFNGSSSGLGTTCSWSVSGAGNYFAFTVSTAGDVNGDGYSDVIVGSNNRNTADIYYGSSSGPSTTPGWSRSGSGQYGNKVACAGDVNGDGYSDVIISSYGIGTAYLYLGSADGLSTTPSWTKTEGNYFGSSVSCAGDVNGDGYSDVVIGDYGYNSNTGRAFLYLGSASGLSITESWTVTGPHTGSYFGASSTAGDINGDGYSDVIAGAMRYANGTYNEGIIYIYNGSPSGLDISYSYSFESNESEGGIGYNVSCGGDVNGDGFSDVCAGAYDYSYTCGKGWLFYGNGSTGSRSNILQCKPGTNTIIPPLGLSGTDGSVRLCRFSKSPFGRADCKLVWELKPNGEPFSGPNSTSYTGMQSGYTNITSGQDLSQDITGLPTMKEYKWRVRTKYSPVNNPYQVYGPWRYYTTYMPVPWGCFKAQDSPLPVSLSSFTHTVERNSVILRWVTSSEENNQGFHVERCSANGIERWVETGFIRGKGTSSVPSVYTFTDHNLAKGNYRYRLKQTDINGNFEFHNLQAAVAIGIPVKYELGQNYPNQFNSETRISFTLPADTRVSLIIYDVSGREVHRLLNSEFRTADYYTVTYNASGLSSGVYFYRLVTNDFTAVKKMILVK